MNLRIWAIASVVAGSLFVAGCGDDDDDGGGGEGSLKANCEKVCATKATLKCPDAPADCINDCQLLATASSKCKTVIEAATACEATRPASDFACDPDLGSAELKETVCTSEYDAVGTCLTTE
jgi:hypothetical protein